MNELKRSNWKGKGAFSRGQVSSALHVSQKAGTLGRVTSDGLYA
jgi:hypothetical protein